MEVPDKKKSKFNLAKKNVLKNFIEVKLTIFLHCKENTIIFNKYEI